MDKILANLDAKVFGPAAAEAAKIKNDTSLAAWKRDGLAKLGANYAAMRSLMGQRGDANAFGNQAKASKHSALRSVVEDLGRTLPAEVSRRPGNRRGSRNDVAADPMTSFAGVPPARDEQPSTTPFTELARPDGAAAQRRPPADLGHAAGRMDALRQQGRGGRR